MEKNRKQKAVYRYCMNLILLLLMICIMLPVTTRNVSAAVNGFCVINGKTYYYVDGVKQKGLIKIKGDTYYFDSKGRMKTGWIKDTNGKKRYFYTKTGKMAVGWVKNSGGKTRYFYTKTGYMATSWATNGSGQKRYFDPVTGYMATGWVKYSDGTKRCFNSKSGVMYSGLNKISKYLFFFDEQTGIMATSAFKTVDGNTYYFKANGFAKSGWLTLSGKKYYFDSEYKMYADKTATVYGKKYVFESDGSAKEIKPQLTQIAEVTDCNVIITDPNGRRYPLVLEYLEHPGIADGSISDLELLAAICECEAGNQGLIGMEAVALCILNRSITKSQEFPTTIRGVIYHGTSFPQYSPVRDGSLLKRLNGYFNNKELAMQAAKNAMTIINNYVTKGTPRTLAGFPKKDFNYLYFMMEKAFWNQKLDFKKVDNYLYVSPDGDSHMFFVDWISPK